MGNKFTQAKEQPSGENNISKTDFNQQAQDGALRVSIVSIIVNLVLSVFKLIAGVAADSGAMISDAVHSASDVFSTIIVIIGVKLSAKEADKEHPYGHERLECVASIILAFVLLETGIGIGISGIRTITGGNYDGIKVPGMLALAAAIISIGVKEWMYWFTIGAANKYNLGALKADAWHHRSDALSSVGALLGIAGARLGYPVLDSVASVGICLFIMKAVYDIFMDAVRKMLDSSCDEETEKKMSELILSQQGVMGLSLLQTRMFGTRIYVDAEIEVDGEMKLKDSHEIAHQVHDAIEREFTSVKHIMIHVNPY